MKCVCVCAGGGGDLVDSMEEAIEKIFFFSIYVVKNYIHSKPRIKNLINSRRDTRSFRF